MDAIAQPQLASCGQELVQPQQQGQELVQPQLRVILALFGGLTVFSQVMVVPFMGALVFRGKLVLQEEHVAGQC